MDPRAGPERPALSVSLYQLRYHGRRYRDIEVIICDLSSCSSFYLQHMAAVYMTDKHLDNFCSFCLLLAAGVELKLTIASLKTVVSVKRLLEYMIRLNTVLQEVDQTFMGNRLMNMNIRPNHFCEQFRSFKN